ncbi:hypothetical protein QRX60_32910 [Amycolatopsis mongoliensis]|uniref:Uncharacterized protein n=1 Tax=Amycolatopsis mongoliensis TaxID=715475 RepID=A0A9Y2JKA9_9PSEU|nr:hypothetical protein [Amycolatopsis sp. 4-36]WIX98841.1 hypothetical protein QRX60_32910 [Amycolatopsis sp. 4-36]
MTHAQPRTNSVLTTPASRTPSIPDGAHVMTATVDLPPGAPVIRAGQAFWEPGGDVIHYRAATNLAGRRGPRD